MQRPRCNGLSSVSFWVTLREAIWVYGVMAMSSRICFPLGTGFPTGFSQCRYVNAEGALLKYTDTLIGACVSTPLNSCGISEASSADMEPP